MRPIMPTYQGQISEEGVIALVEYIKNLNSDYRIQQTLNTTELLPESEGGKPAPAGQTSPRRRGGEAMSAATIVSLPDQSTARIPKMNFLTKENGLLSWLLTGDHKRIATLYLISITFFFFIGGALAGLIRLELLTPQTDLMAADTYNKVFTMHGVIMVFFFLVPSVPATIGNFLIPMMVGAKDLALPKINLLSWYLYIVAGIMMHLHHGRRRRGHGLDLHHPALHALREHPRDHHRPGDLRRRIQLHLYRAQLHRHHPQDALPGHDLVPAAAVRLVELRGQHSHGAGHAGSGHHPGADRSRAHRRHRRLRSRQGRRSAALPASVLVLLAPRRLHHDSARHGRHLRGGLDLQPQARLRLHGGRVFLGGHRGLRLLRLGPPHVHHGHLELRRAGVLAAHHAGRGALGHQDLQLGLHALQGLHHL